jgi:hypothetical protein
MQETMFKKDYLDIGCDEVALLLWLGTRLTVFYRRRFDFSEHTRPLIDLVSLGLAITNSYLQTHSFVSSSGAIFYMWPFFETFFRVESTHEMLKSLLLSCSFCFAVTGTVASLSWIAVTVMASTQLLRWPPALKVYLRNIRTMCGPSYAIFIAGACLKEMDLSDVGSQDEPQSRSFLLPPSLLQFSAVSAIFASIMFRPDNQAVWSLLPYADDLRRLGLIPSPEHQKRIHASLMVLSYVCMVVKLFLLEFDLPLRTLGCFLIAMSCIGLVMGVSSIRNFLNLMEVKHTGLLNP